MVEAPVVRRTSTNTSQPEYLYTRVFERRAPQKPITGGVRTMMYLFSLSEPHTVGASPGESGGGNLTT